MTVTISYPYDTPHSLTLELPSPSFGDILAVDHKVIAHQSMSGEMRSYRRTGNRYSLTHNYLDIPAETIDVFRANLRNLIIGSVGEQVRLVIDTPDADELWSVYIITINPTLSARTRNYYELTLEYEGVRIS